jgi:hypothetical protein
MEDNNLPEKVAFRQSILQAQEQMKQLIEAGELPDVSSQCTLTHYFVPKSKKYGAVVYGRQIFLPAGSIVVGKIHRESHLNLIMQGKVSVNTEFGLKRYEAPCIFVSEPGLKRAVLAETDVLWVTVHLTEHSGEDHLEEIEDEVISPTYYEMGLTETLKIGDDK